MSKFRLIPNIPPPPDGLNTITAIRHKLPTQNCAAFSSKREEKGQRVLKMHRFILTVKLKS